MCTYIKITVLPYIIRGRMADQEWIFEILLSNTNKVFAF